MGVGRRTNARLIFWASTSQVYFWKDGVLIDGVSLRALHVHYDSDLGTCRNSNIMQHPKYLLCFLSLDLREWLSPGPKRGAFLHKSCIALPPTNMAPDKFPFEGPLSVAMLVGGMVYPFSLWGPFIGAPVCRVKGFSTASLPISQALGPP